MDVFEKEPYFGKFTKLDNVILTPHIGSYSSEIRSEMAGFRDEPIEGASSIKKVARLEKSEE